MILRKSICLSAALAISNPVCCCIAEGVFADSSGKSELLYVCCATAQDVAGSPVESDCSHEPSDCGHKVFKDYEASLLSKFAPKIVLERMHLRPLFAVSNAAGFPLFDSSSCAILVHFGGSAQAPPLRNYQKLFCTYWF